MIEAGLRAALSLNELRVVFQPLVGLKENRVTCFEALLRWTHDGVAISPVEFIPIAEETGADRADRRVGAARGLAGRR